MQRDRAAQINRVGDLRISQCLSEYSEGNQMQVLRTHRAPSTSPECHHRSLGPSRYAPDARPVRLQWDTVHSAR